MNEQTQVNEENTKFTPEIDPRTIEVNKLYRVPAGGTRLSDVQATRTEWLWKPYIPRGKITLITADPGVGKTFLALYLTAQVSSGEPFYGEPEDAYRMPEFAVFQTAEDGFADTIKPRLTPMLPDFSHILNIDETHEALSLTDQRIEQIMYECQPALMVFDPLQAYLGADVDMHRANAVRPVLAHISRLAEMYNTAVVFIMHNSKMQQNKAIYRALGSIDITAVARSMLVIGNSPEGDGSLTLCQEKSSLAEPGRSVRFSLLPDGGGIEFLGYSDATADEVLLSPHVRGKRPTPKLDEAVAALNQLLWERGFVEFDEVAKLVEEQKISLQTMYSAKKELHVRSVRAGFENGKYYWALPCASDEEIKNAHFSQPYPLDLDSL